MEDKDVLIISDSSKIEYLTKDEAALVSKELVNVREEIRDCSYLDEALKVLPVKGYRSAIGAYWNAVIDDLRQKIMHRSLDLFNKEIKPKKNIEKYEDFQDHVTENDLIEGAYKIGILSWEGRKLMHQARETRNVFFGHPKSTEPGLLKVLNLISDCNKYVLSQEYPTTIINISTYLSLMDSPDFDRNTIAVEQAFADLPAVYKTELSNRFYSTYKSDSISSDLRGNIEFCAPILWATLTKEDRKQVGKRFDKEILEGDKNKILKSLSYIKLVNGIMYINSASRKVIIEPLINELEKELDNWDKEAELIKSLYPLSRYVPDDLLQNFVAAITRTFIGYKGQSHHFARTCFYSDEAAPFIKEMFMSFDSTRIDIFTSIIKTDSIIRRRIKEQGQLDRLRVLSTIILEKEIATPESKDFLELLCDTSQTEELFTKVLPKTK